MHGLGEKLILSQEQLIQVTHYKNQMMKKINTKKNKTNDDDIYFLNQFDFRSTKRHTESAFILNCDHHCFSIHDLQNLQIAFKIQCKMYL